MIRLALHQCLYRVESGYFERSLNAYGREGEPCPRCEALGLQTTIRRDVLMKRSSYTCPVCQRRPRNGRW